MKPTLQAAREFCEEDCWLCPCGDFIEDGMHCDCGREPPWGCPCNSCQDGPEHSDDCDCEECLESAAWMPDFEEIY